MESFNNSRVEPVVSAMPRSHSTYLISHFDDAKHAAEHPEEVKGARSQVSI